jgi:signal transduction histidine kinase
VRALIIEDYESDARLLTRELRRGGRDFEVQVVASVAAARAALTEGAWDIVCTDWKLPGFGALEILALVKELGLDTPVIVVSGTLTEDLAVAAMRAGARDFVPKDRIALVTPAVERELADAESRAARRRADDERRAAGQAADARRQAKRQQIEVMDALGRLAGEIAHDFNNILSVVLSYSDTLLALIDPGELHHDVEQIHSAASRGATLTRQLLMFNRLQLVEQRDVDLNEVIAGLAGVLKRLAERDITFVSRPDPALGPLWSEQTSLELVVTSLVNNAAEAMPRGGTLTIETANITLEPGELREPLEVPAGRYVRLSVSDTGKGMDAATRARMFEPFFTTKSRGRGTGLGLSTVFGIVHQSGGHFWVDSAPGVGTTVNVYLPRIEPVPQRVLQTAARHARRGPLPRP